ncbi:MAG TPA: hypothetical protein VG603_07415, partial [Chitinophagales bacterium]|nr:hypothetical protein [Chitinophagales bacterium]
MENERIKHLGQLGEMLANNDVIAGLSARAESANPWFVPRFVGYSLNAIANEMLAPAKLEKWLSAYSLHPVDKTIGLIFAGNIPLVGFHDFLCCYMAGCRMQIKLSSKDDALFPALLNKLFEID